MCVDNGDETIDANGHGRHVAGEREGHGEEAVVPAEALRHVVLPRSMHQHDDDLHRVDHTAQKQINHRHIHDQEVRVGLEFLGAEDGHQHEDVAEGAGGEDEQHKRDPEVEVDVADVVAEIGVGQGDADAGGAVAVGVHGGG